MPGRLARRLIADWHQGLLQDDPHDEQSPDALSADWACPRLRAFYRQKTAATMDHDLIVLPSQTYHEETDSGTGTLLSCLCRACRYHFVFKISPGTCGGTNREYPQHHFILQGWSEFDPQDVEAETTARLYPLRCRASYYCSVCPQTVDVEMTAPRLMPEWIRLITDEKRIREAYKMAVKEDPERYQNGSLEMETRYATTPLETLNHYLKDILEAAEDSRRRISHRNKSFMVQFGGSCGNIFRYLGFSVEEGEDDTEWFWIPPRLPPQVEKKTPLGSARAFIEDVRSEVQNLLEGNPPRVGEPVVELVSPPARLSLEKALKASPNSTQNVRDTLKDKDEAADYRRLGAATDADDEVLKYAYQRQVNTDPGRKAVYLDALNRLGTRRDMDFQLFCFAQHEVLPQMQTSNPASDDPADIAYAHFNLTRNLSEPASYIINVYKTFRENSPAHKSQHRTHLLAIGEDRNGDQEILHEVYTIPMEPSEACSYLGVDSRWPLENIAAFVQTELVELDRGLALLALETISITNEDTNRDAFNNLLAELRSQPPNFTSANGNTHGTSEKSGNEAVDMTLPVGLGNLRNTCYLNSILQYLYTVRSVRNLVLNSEQPRLPATDHGVRALLGDSGLPGLEPGRAFVGSEFSRELAALFRSLNTCGDSFLTPKQRLANAALLIPDKFRRVEQATSVAKPVDKDAPPLPPRDSKVTAGPVLEICDNTSARSSQTLVENSESDPSYVVVSHNAAEKDDGSAMEIDTPEATAAPAPAAATPLSISVPDTTRLTVEELATELDKPNVGSEQMDVDEVMGNVIDHLQAAYKVAQISRSDTGPDPIEHAFFSRFVDNRKKSNGGGWNRSERWDRWVNAFPAVSGRRDLYEAISASFDLERLDSGFLQFTTIDRPAPNFHICIRRSDNADGVTKNSNPIEIPETLYLDRFMHITDPSSEVFKSKKRSWDVMNRLHELEPTGHDTSKQAIALGGGVGLARVEGVEDVDEVDGFLTAEAEAVGSTACEIDPDEGWSFIDSTIQTIRTNLSSMEDEDPALLPDPPSRGDEDKASRPASLSAFWDAFQAAAEDEQVNLKADKDGMFRSMENFPYRLHAVVCHAGATASVGHYWVWIHDFEQNVWRKYNDTRVSVHSEASVFEELNTKGEPFYLAYVRASEIGDHVNIPPRTQIVNVAPVDGGMEV